MAIAEVRGVESTETSAGFSYETDTADAEPIIRYQLNVDMLAGIPDKQTISIYGDGRVVVHNPAYMKQAGYFEMRLTADELDQLIADISKDGLMDFDHRRTRGRIAEVRKAMRDMGQVYAISDDVETVVEIKLAEFQRDSRSKRVKNFSKQFRWKNLSHDAVRYSDEAAITRANAAVNRLTGLKKDGRLKRVVHP